MKNWPKLANLKRENTSTNWRKRRILEAWEINTCNNPINRDDGMHLPHEFLNLAFRDKH